MTTPDQRLTQEMLATADSLRSVRSRLSFLVQANDPRTSAGWPEVSLILTQGLDVAVALETLALEMRAIQRASGSAND